MQRDHNETLKKQIEDIPPDVHTNHGQMEQQIVSGHFHIVPQLNICLDKSADPI